eukprot:m.291985 g.291985  ORF g.291985 m.291985 type:complete len:566 (+) comp15831_c0_seq6:270-1967(+)
MVSSVIAAAATGIGTLWVVNILGALLAIFPRRKDAAKSGLLTHNGLLVISKLSTLVLLPTLMGTSVAKTLDLEALQTAWPMLIWHVVATLLCVGIASVIAWVTGRPASIRKMFIVGSAFGNASDMALFVMSILCSQPNLQGVEQCMDRSAAYIGLGALPLQFLFWTVGATMLQSAQNELDAAKHENMEEIPHLRPAALANQEQQSMCTRALVVLKHMFHPIIIGILVGLAIALIPGARGVFYADESDSHVPPLGFVAESLRFFAEPSVGILRIFVAATLGKRLFRLHVFVRFLDWLEGSSSCLASCCFDNTQDDGHVDSHAVTANIDIAHVIDKETGEVVEVSEWIVETTSADAGSDHSAYKDPVMEPLPAPASGYHVLDLDALCAGTSPSTSTVSVGSAQDQFMSSSPVASQLKVLTLDETKAIFAVQGGVVGADSDLDQKLVLKTPQSDLYDDGVAKPGEIEFSNATATLLSLTRIVLLPTILFGLVYVLSPYFFTGPDAALLRLVLYTQSFVPSATFTVVVAQEIGNRAFAEGLAANYLGQYSLIGLLMVATTYISLLDTFP